MTGLSPRLRAIVDALPLQPDSRPGDRLWTGRSDGGDPLRELPLPRP